MTKHRRVFTLLVGLLLALGGWAAFSPAASAATQNCGSTVDNPHLSSGAKGNIVKSRTSCVGSVAEVRIHLNLWKCPKHPTGDKEQWKAQGCTIVKSGTRQVKNPTNNTKYTTYAPPTGQTGAKGAGWYAGVATTTAYNSAGKNIVFKTEGSAWVYLAS